MARSAKSVYDSDDQKEAIKPDLGKREKVSSVPAEQLERIPTLSEDEGEKIEREALADLESSEGAATSVAYQDEAPSLYKKNARHQGFSGFVSKNLKGRRGLLAIGSGLIAAVISLIVLFLSLIPLKVEHMIKNLDKTFSQTTTAAIQKEEQNALRHYFKKYIIGNASCGVRVHKDCVIPASSNPITKTYKAWRDAKIEDTWSKQYGIEVQFRAGQYYLKAPGTAAGGDALGADEQSAGRAFDQEFTKSSRAEVRQAFNDAYEKETQKSNIFKRYVIGRLLEEKYGIKRCIVFCGTRDSLADYKDKQKYAAKIFLVERIIQPRSASLGVILNCILNDACLNSDPNNHCAASTCNELAGEAQDGSDQAVEDALKEATAGFGSPNAAKIIAIIDDARAKGGFRNYVLDKALTKLISKQFSQKAIPVIGWVFLFDKATTFVHDTGSGGLLYKKYAYLANAAPAISLYQEYQTYADEIHTGNVTATEVGSFVNSLSAGNQCATDFLGDCGSQKGGTAGAEQTKIYQMVMSNKSLDETSGVKLTCDNGKVLTPTQAVCPEERLGVNNDVLDSIKSFEDDSGLTAITNVYRGICVPIVGPCLRTVLHSVNNLLDWLLGPASGLIGTAFQHFPGYSTIAAAVDKFIGYIAEQFIPNPFGVAMSGGRTFAEAAAGADATNHDTCESIGCQKVSSVVYNNIINEQFRQDKADFATLPLKSRIFSTDSSYSLASQIIDSVPLNPQGSFVSNIASISSFNNFLSKLTAGLHLFGNNKAEALNAAVDPYGVTQMGYPANTIPDDPESYWDSHNCGDNSENGPIAKWAQAAKDAPVDPDNGMPVHTYVEPCLLIAKTASSIGGKFDYSLLSPDEQEIVNGGTTSAGTTTGGSTTPGGCGGTGPYSAVVDSGANFAGVDQGIDFTPQTSAGFNICAPASGTITLADQTGHHFNRTSGQAEIIERLDAPPGPIPSISRQYIYYAEIIQINSAIKVGTHVNKGDVLGHNNASPGIEVGWAPSATNGFGCSVGGRTVCGTDFDSWVQAQ